MASNMSNANETEKFNNFLSFLKEQKSNVWLKRQLKTKKWK